MADKYQTQCPHCGVKFQITAQQLTLANGTVRCGSCLQVFQASQKLVPLADNAPAAGVGSARGTGSARPSTPPPPARPPAPTPPQRPAAAAAPARPPVPPRPTAPVADSDDDLADMILRELEEAPLSQPAKPARPAARPTPAPAPPPAPAPAPKVQAPSPSWGAAPPPAKPAASSEPQWAAPPPAPAPAAPPAPRYAVEENKTRISIGGGQLNSKLLDNDDDVFGASGSTLLEDEQLGADSADEGWAKALIGEGPVDERDEKLRKFQIKADDLSMSDQTGVQKRSGLAERMSRMDGSKAGTTAGAVMPGPQIRTAPTAAKEDDGLDFLDDGLTMQDVELPGLDADVDVDVGAASSSHQVDWGGNVLWGTLSAVFALAFIAQYFAFNMDTLARDSSWRGMYEVACGAFGCSMPDASDITRLQGANLVIRSHPTAGQALIIDAVVYNRAPFAQPFPNIELGFSDAHGEAVAGRVFTPDEYLKGELAGQASMPPDTPIHLTLELVDPGASALNYELRFMPPDAS